MQTSPYNSLNLLSCKGVNERLQVALDQAAQGRSIIPQRAAQSKDERAVLVKWKPYQTERPTPGLIRDWWNTWPDANPLIVTGAISDLVAFDIDSAEGLAWIEALGIPHTFTVSRGHPVKRHLWFKHPGFKVSNMTLAPGVEVKGDGGTIPPPGAIHWSGAPYDIADDAPLADLPEALIERLRPVERPPRPLPELTANDHELAALAINAISPARADEYYAWVEVGMALRELGSTGLALWEHFSSQSSKYKPGECARKWKTFDPSKKTLGSLFYLADQDSPGWRPRQAHPITIHKTACHKQSRQVAAIIADPDEQAIPAHLLDLCRSGLSDDWAGLLRHFFKQGALAIWVAAVATVKGMHSKYDSFSPAMLADYAVQLGCTKPTDRHKMERACAEALEKLTAEQVLTTDSEEDSSVVKTRFEQLFRFNSLQDISYAVSRWLDPRAEQAAAPGYDPRPVADDSEQEYRPEPVEVSLRADHFMGEIGMSEDDAWEAAEAIERIVGKPDEVAARRARNRKHKTLVDYDRRLYQVGTVTPLAKGWMFCNYEQFDLARYRGAVEHRPESAAWSQREWCRFLGVSKGTLINLRKKAGLRTKEQTKRLSLDASLPARVQVRQFARNAKGKPLRMEVYDGQACTVTPEQYTTSAAEEHLRAGHGVSIIFQVASITEIDPLAALPSQPAAPASLTSVPNEPTAAKAAPAEPSKKRAGPRFKPYHGPGFSKAWVWSQLALKLIRVGYPEQAVAGLSFDDALALARGRIRLRRLYALVLRQPALFAALPGQAQVVVARYGLDLDLAEEISEFVTLEAAA